MTRSLHPVQVELEELRRPLSRNSTRPLGFTNRDSEQGLGVTQTLVDRNDVNNSEGGGTATVPAYHDSLPQATRLYQSFLLCSGFLMAFHVIGLNSSYGVFQQFYTSTQTNIKDGMGQDALVSLVGTIGTGLTWSGSIFVNPLISSSRLNIKIVALSGAFFMSLGLFLASFATKLWHLFLTQALLYGLGASMYYFPILAVTPLYFDRHRGFAMGIVLAGSSLGGLVFASVQQYLLDHHGIQWSLRILGIWNFAVGIPVSMVIQRHPSSFRGGDAERRRWINTVVLSKGTFWFQALGAFLQAGGNVVPIYYIVAYSVSVLSFSPSTGSTLLSVNSGVNCLSRVVMGILADYVGRQNTLIGGVVLSALSVFALWYSAAKARFIAFVVVYGIFAGGYNALLPTTIVEIYGLRNYAAVNGNLLFIRGLGSLFGAPLAGMILGSHARIIGIVMETGMGGTGKEKLEMKFNDVVVYDGVLLLISALCVVYVRWLDAVEKRRWRWRA